MNPSGLTSWLQRSTDDARYQRTRRCLADTVEASERRVSTFSFRASTFGEKTQSCIFLKVRDKNLHEVKSSQVKQRAGRAAHKAEDDDGDEVMAGDQNGYILWVGSLEFLLSHRTVPNEAGDHRAARTPPLAGGGSLDPPYEKPPQV